MTVAFRIQCFLAAYRFSRTQQGLFNNNDAREMGFYAPASGSARQNILLRARSTWLLPLGRVISTNAFSRIPVGP